jgi:hypothetical protein
MHFLLRRTFTLPGEVSAEVSGRGFGSLAKPLREAPNSRHLSHGFSFAWPSTQKCLGMSRSLNTLGLRFRDSHLSNKHLPQRFACRPVLEILGAESVDRFAVPLTHGLPVLRQNRALGALSGGRACGVFINSNAISNAQWWE